MKKRAIGYLPFVLLVVLVALGLYAAHGDKPTPPIDTDTDGRRAREEAAESSRGAAQRQFGPPNQSGESAPPTNAEVRPGTVRPSVRGRRDDP
jgi:hypothetical protein